MLFHVSENVCLLLVFFYTVLYILCIYFILNVEFAFDRFKVGEYLQLYGNPLYLLANICEELNWTYSFSYSAWNKTTIVFSISVHSIPDTSDIDQLTFETVSQCSISCLFFFFLSFFVEQRIEQQLEICFFNLENECSPLYSWLPSCTWIHIHFQD